MTHVMAYGDDNNGQFIFPTVVQKSGDTALTELSPTEAAIYAKKSGEYIHVGNDPNFAEYFSTVGYKRYFSEDDYNEAKKEYVSRTKLKK
jgi:hypothetical protein